MANLGSSYSPIWTAGSTNDPISGRAESSRYVGGVGVRSGNGAEERAWQSELTFPGTLGSPRAVALSPAPILPPQQITYNQLAPTIHIGGGSASAFPGAAQSFKRDTKDFDGFRRDFGAHTQGLGFGGSDRASYSPELLPPLAGALPAPSTSAYSAPVFPQGAEATYLADFASAPVGTQPMRDVSRTAAPVVSVFDDLPEPAASGSAPWWSGKPIPARTPEQFMSSFYNHFGATDGFGQRTTSGISGQVVMDLPQS